MTEHAQTITPAADIARRRQRRLILDLATHEAEFVTLGAIARYLVSDRRVVLKWIQAGSLAGYCFEGEWRVRTADLRAFVSSCRYRVDAAELAS